MLFVSKIGKQLFGGKFCFPPKFFCLEIWTEHVEDGFREAFIFNRKGKRNFNLTFIFESSTYPSYTFHPHFFAKPQKMGEKTVFFEVSKSRVFFAPESSDGSPGSFRVQHYPLDPLKQRVG